MEILSFRCPKCATTKPATEFHKNKSRKTGYGTECKPCALARAKRSYDADPDKYRARSKARYASDPEFHRAWARTHRENNLELVKATVKRYKDANPEKMKAIWQDWAPKNQERLLQNNRRKRAIKKAVPSEKYTKDDILAAWGADCHLCSKPIDLTAPRRSRYGLQLDHVMPISKGGPDTISNVKPAHAYCNQSKKDKVIPSAQSHTELE